MYARGKSIDNIHLVRERDRRRFRELLAVLSLGVPIGVFLLLFTWQNVEVIRLAREATRQQRIVDTLRDENRKLALQVEKKTALEKVESQADDLGLRPVPGEQRVVVLDGETSIDVASLNGGSSR